jgi:hypothetical protein
MSRLLSLALVALGGTIDYQGTDPRSLYQHAPGTGVRANVRELRTFGIGKKEYLLGNCPLLDITGDIRAAFALIRQAQKCRIASGFLIKEPGQQVQLNKKITRSQVSLRVAPLAGVTEKVQCTPTGVEIIAPPQTCQMKKYSSSSRCLAPRCRRVHQPGKNVLIKECSCPAFLFYYVKLSNF